MQRRKFSRLAATAAVLGPQSFTSMSTPSSLLQASSPAPATRGPAARPATGTNLSGMEWTKPGLRYGLSTGPNLHFTVPRKADIAYLASCGFKKSRLPIQWELLQPMLSDTRANEVARKLIGEPGAFHAAYASYITDVLDAHAAVGMTCIIDNHNYCRYQDFKFQPDGGVLGLTAPPNEFYRPYSADPSQVQVRIFALAPGATLTQAHFVDFWTRAAQRWKGHPGLAGYGLMNEPHQMPALGQLVGSDESPGKGEDLEIWPAYAKAAVEAIRKIDAATPIYVAGNEWSSAMSMGTKNPGFPLRGDNLIYEVHLYLDARNTGGAFDYETESSRDSTAGFGRGGIKPSIGFDRLKIATDWAKAKNVKIALTEVGMPIDDARWEPIFASTARLAVESDCEVYTWMGGNHWPIRNYAINHVPGWHQNKTLEPLVSGTLKAAIGMAQAVLFDDGPGYARVGEPVAITVYARGNLVRPVVLEVTATGKGALSKMRLTIPAGANGRDSFTFAPAANQVASLRYAVVQHGEAAAPTPPPGRRVFSLVDPAAHGDLDEAANSILAKYSACKWDLGDAYTDYVLGQPASAGQAVRAVADSGYGSGFGNAMEMLNFINKDTEAMGSMSLPVLRMVKGKKTSDHSAPDNFGLWCKKSVALPGVQPRPVNRVPYHIEDAHFMIAAVSIPTNNNSGAVFQVSKAESTYLAEVGFANGQPVAKWLDAKGQKVQLNGPAKIAPNTPVVISCMSVPGAQKLRINAVEVDESNATFAPGACNQMLIGWGYANYYPQGSFGGNVYAVVTGKGAPSVGELRVLERYLAGVAGVGLG